MSDYSFKPTNDITVLELANIFNAVMIALLQIVSQQTFNPNDTLDIESEIYNSLPAHIQKHFVEKK